MKITFLLHSATGNTRQVVRYAASRLATDGHVTVVHDIVKHPDPPALEGVDLLAVACPTMYFRPTFAMERFLERLPDAPGMTRPAFLLATAGGEPGAHFEILARILERKGYRTLGAHFVLCPDSWPPHLHAVRHLGRLSPIGELLARRGPRSLRSLWAVAWPGLGDPDQRDRAGLDRFLERMLVAAASARSGAATPPAVTLHRAMLWLDALGRRIRREEIEPYARPRFDAAVCDGCGTCVASCPAKIIVQAQERSVPTVGPGCTGCFACYNHCPTGAISAWASPGGKAQYRGPSTALRELFSSRRAE